MGGVMDIDSEKMGNYNCKICGEEIVKYGLDLGNTIQLCYDNKNWIYVCDKCAVNIANQLIHR